jgi:DNA-3-methyladenine glycosylase I
MEENNKIRCFGNKPNQKLYAEYHDTQWGEPVHNDQQLFEKLTLEGAQAGLSWEIVLKRQAGYRKAFYNFDVAKIAVMSTTELEALRDNPEIIRNRLKIYSVRQNACVFLKIQEEFGTFNNYVWSFVNYEPIINNWQTLKDIPANTPISDLLSKDLKKRGMTFVGTTIIYSYMQAIGMVDDHIATCWLRLKPKT